MGKKLTNIEFIKRAEKIHNHKYDYSLVNYKNMYEKVIIICSIHSKFLQMPLNHLKGAGCEKCSYIYRSNTLLNNINDVIKKAKLKHNNFYNYDNFIYTGCKNKSIIICPNHGEFLQSMDKHFNCKTACPKCLKEKRGFNKSKFINLSDEANFYIIRCWNDEEEFYKVGITTQSIKYRFITKVKMPYNYEIIFEIKDKNKNIYELEKNILKKFKSFKYKPKIKFSGNTECLTNNILNEKYDIQQGLRDS